MTSLRERVKRVWEVLDEDPHYPGNTGQAWFARQVDRLVGWPVSEPTVHRWLYRKTPIDVRCFEVLAKLETEAIEVLTVWIEEAPAKLEDDIRAAKARLEDDTQSIKHCSETMVALWTERLDKLTSGKDGT